MEPVGRLTMSGKLYEGNYPEWAERMSALLEEHYGGIEPDYSPMSSTTDPRDFVLAEVSPSILSRLPDLLTTNATPDAFDGWPTLELAKELISCHLKKAAQPFKFMNLPIELRKDICDLAISSRGEIRWSLGAKVRRRRIHAITRVCRALRRETSKAAWAKVRLCIEEYDSTFWLSVSNRYFFLRIHRQLSPFYGTQYLSDLRTVSLDLRVRRVDLPVYSTFKLHFTYSPSAGLGLEIPVNAYHALTPESVNRLKSHVRWASRDLDDDYSKCGGALIRALTAVPQLWQERVLVCEHKLRA
jgi:hypothetical protein